MSEVLLDRAGRRRSPATMPGFHAGRSPRNRGLRYPADPPKVEEIVAGMCAAREAGARAASHETPARRRGCRVIRREARHAERWDTSDGFTALTRRHPTQTPFSGPSEYGSSHHN